MIVKNKDLLQAFRDKGACEYCGKKAKQLEPAHLFAKGMGGGFRCDIKENLIALCFLCHAKQHGQNRDPSRDDLFEIVAKREGMTVDEIKEKTRRIQEDDKCDVWEV